MQTPDSKARMKEKEFYSPEEASADKPGPRPSASANRKRLDFPSSSVGELLGNETGKQKKNALDKEVERLRDERDCLSSVLNQKREELCILKSQPVPLQPLPIPGNAVMRSICDNCHHRGHRATGNITSITNNARS